MELTAYNKTSTFLSSKKINLHIVKLEESVELAPKLDAFMAKLKAGQDVSARAHC